MDRVLHHDHRTINDHAKVDCAQAHQVRAEVEDPHVDEAYEHGQGNDRSGDQRSTHVAEEEEENDRDKDETLEEILLDGANGTVNHA
jgi:hypothetical protein